MVLRQVPESVPASAANLLKNRIFRPRPIYAGSWKCQGLVFGDKSEVIFTLPAAECQTEASAGKASA